MPDYRKINVAHAPHLIGECEREAWVRFAAAALATNAVSTEQAAAVADKMAVEFRRRFVQELDAAA